MLHSLLATGYCLMVANYLNFHFNFELSRLLSDSLAFKPTASHISPCESRLFSLPDSFSSYFLTFSTRTHTHSTVACNELSLRSLFLILRSFGKSRRQNTKKAKANKQTRRVTCFQFRIYLSFSSSPSFSPHLYCSLPLSLTSLTSKCRLALV